MTEEEEEEKARDGEEAEDTDVRAGLTGRGEMDDREYTGRGAE